MVPVFLYWREKLHIVQTILENFFALHLASGPLLQGYFFLVFLGQIPKETRPEKLVFGSRTII